MTDVDEEIREVKLKILAIEEDIKTSINDGKSEAYVIACKNELIACKNELVELRKKENILLGAQVKSGGRLSVPDSLPVDDHESNVTGRLKKATFIFCARDACEEGKESTDGKDNPLYPQGTVFAFSQHLCITANHNSFVESDHYFERYYAARMIFRPLGTDVANVIDAIELIVVERDFANDWLVLRRADGGLFTDWIELGGLEDLPTASSSAYIRVVYAPVNLYYQNQRVCHNLELIASHKDRFISFEPDYTENDIPTRTTKLITTSEWEEMISNYVASCNILVSDGGIMGGGCGAPNISETNKALGMHLYSGSESMSLNNILTKVQESSKKRKAEPEMLDSASVVAGYSSIKRALVFSRVPSLVKFLRNHNIELNPSLS